MLADIQRNCRMLVGYMSFYLYFLFVKWKISLYWTNWEVEFSAQGKLHASKSVVDESMLTSESLLVFKE